MKKRTLIGIIVAFSTVAIYATCTDNVNLANHKIKTTATEFADNELVPKSYVANMIETNMKNLPKTITVQNGDVTETYGVIVYNGRAWFDRNLGATEAPKDWNDTNPNTWGELHQWGKNRGPYAKRDSVVAGNCAGLQDKDNVSSDFHKGTDKAYDWVSNQSGSCSNGLLTKGWWHDATAWDSDANRANGHNVCPAGWSVPSVEDFRSLNANTPQEAFEKIKLNAAGWRDRNGNVNDLSNGTNGMYYWTSTPANNEQIYFLHAREDVGVVMKRDYRANGMSIRCVKHLY